MKFLNNRCAALGLIALASFLVWGQSLRFDFVWDDGYFIFKNPSIRSLKNIPEMFWQIDAQAWRADDFRVYRPLRTAHYAVLHFIGGKEAPQPWIFHLANVLWHTATAMLLYAVAGGLFRLWRKNLPEEDTRLWALLAALGFAVHPVVSEVVCWAKSLDDIMAAFFTLAALRELLLWKNARENYGRSLFYFLLAVYSKESAVPFAAIPFFIFWRGYNLPWRRNILLTSGFLAIAALHMVHRHLVIGRSSQTEPISGTYGQTLLDMLPIVLKYVRLLWGAPPFCIDYSYLKGHFTFWSMPVLSGLFLLAGLVALAVVCWRSETFRVAGFGLLWVGLFLLPVSNLLPMMQYLAERFLYLPLIGWLLALAALLSGWRRVPTAMAFYAAAILIWIPVAGLRAPIWADQLTLFVQSHQQGPSSQRVMQNAMYAVFQMPTVAKIFQRDDKTGKITVSGNISPTDKQALLGIFQEARKLFPRYDQIPLAMGICHAMTGQPGQAAVFFEEAVRLSPNDINNWLNLAQSAVESQNFPRAREALEKVDALEPNQPRTVRLWGTLHWQMENFAEAFTSFQKLQTLESNGDAAHWMQEAQKKMAAAGEK